MGSWTERLREPGADLAAVVREAAGAMPAISLLEILQERLEVGELPRALEAAVGAYSGTDRLRCLRTLASLEEAPAPDRARWNSDLATLLEDLDRLEEAAEALGRAAELAGDGAMKARLLNRLGTVRHARGDQNGALESYERSLALKESAGDDRGAWNTLLNLANLYREMGEPTSALEHARRAAKLDPDSARRARAEAVVAHAALEAGESGDHLDRARAAFRSAGDREGEAALLLEQASVLSRLGRAGEALAVLNGMGSEIPENLRARAEALRQRVQPGESRVLLDRMLQINRAILARHDPAALLRDIVDGAVELLSAERGFCILAAEKGFEIGAARHVSRETIRDAQFNISRGLADWVARNGEAVLTGRAGSEPSLREYKSLEELRVKSIACVPMRAADRLLGALYVDHRERPDAFSRGDLETLQALAEQAAVALTQVRLLEENLRQQKLLEQANARLRASNRVLEQRVRTQTEVLERVKSAGRDRYDQLVGSSSAMQEIYRQLTKIESSAETVLITGESGTGKELLARAIHQRSSRSAGPFVPVNCGALTETLLDSELFGHVKGAFTGAAADRPGVFEQAEGGTLFLDEIGETSAETQKRLLRVLQQKEIRRVGDQTDRKVNVRVVAATNRDLSEAVSEREFREDLFYRLNVLRVHVPPLRERREDIPLLVDHFLDRIATEQGGARPPVGPGFVDRLLKREWPGNVRQLENAVRRIVALGEESLEAEEAPTVSRTDALRSLEEVELEHIRRVLAATAGNVTEAARILGVGSATLWRRLRKHDLRPSDR